MNLTIKLLISFLILGSANTFLSRLFSRKKISSEANAYINYLKKFKKNKLSAFTEMQVRRGRSPQNFEYRQKIYTENLAKIAQINAEDETWKAGENQFTDLSEAEIAQYTGLGNSDQSSSRKTLRERYQNRIDTRINRPNLKSTPLSNLRSRISFRIKNLRGRGGTKGGRGGGGKKNTTPVDNPVAGNPFPDGTLFSDLYNHGSAEDQEKYLSVDWEELRKVTPVKDQGSCGSCWAFATIAALESAYLIEQGEGLDFDLSEQYLVSDCLLEYDCGGGWLSTTYDWMMQGNPVPIDKNMMYLERNTACLNAEGPDYNLTGYTSLGAKGDMFEFLIMLSKQPVTVGISANNTFSSYKEGIISRSTKSRINHAILATGYVIDKVNPGNSYIRLKNSWGTGWGEDGYVKLKLENIKFTNGMLNIIYENDENLAPTTL